MGSGIEKYARKRYVKKSRSGHKHFKCEETGLKLHPERFMLGSSVNGMVSGACCGIGCLEIKCPFSHRENTVGEYVQESDSCLEQSTGNLPKMKYCLKHTHQYYIQVKHQMFVTDTSYAVFLLYLHCESMQSDP